ncbi:ecto-NOX disulfide-thiol exchanger 1-like isoform X1 [Halichondria panicea]|uniref:ecto-NOX disulfide-thiol exchanger 1-like isoform X1 n=1 Tax=Halichondria panicea TaxID=6063 RepID=UPI00312B3779
MMLRMEYIIMSSYRDYDDDPYPRDSYPRKRTLAQDVFRDEFSARERVYRNELRPGPPPPGPGDSYYRRMDERDARELIGRGPPFGEPAFEPPLLSPKDSLLPLDHPLPFEELLPPGGERLGHEGRRFGSVIVFPPKVPRFPVDLNEPPSRTLYVGTLPRNTTKHHLEDLFSPFGQIEYIHLNNKFAHIQFELRDKNGLMRALDLDGSYINVGPSNSPEDYGPIVVQFSVRKQDSESESSQEHRPIELMRYTGINAANLASSLYKKSKFLVAAKSLKSWFDQGQCSSASANTFYTLLTSTNTCTRRAKKTLKDKGEELKSTLWKHKKELDDMKNDCQALVEIFQAAFQQRSWDRFSKPQRKMITQWSESATELMKEVEATSNNLTADGQPLTKRGHSAEVDSLRRQVNQLRAEKKVAIQGRDQQIQNLKSTLTVFKEDCPSEWERIAEGKDFLQDWNDETSSTGSVHDEDSDLEDAPLEIIEEFIVDVSPTPTVPGNDMDIEDQEAKDERAPSLAAAAAAYAQIRSSIGSSEHQGLSEPEVAIVSVMSAFLSVHPLGASIEEITAYFQGFNPSYNSHYLESLLRRLSKVFQITAGGAGDLPRKWWFLGFQTCYTAVGNPKTAAAATETEDHTSDS